MAKTDMKLIKTVFTAAAATLISASGMAGDTDRLAAKAPAVIQLHDQYDAPQTISFPTTNIIVLTIADRKGSEQVDGWIAALKPRYLGRVDIRGLADVGGVPVFLQKTIRQRFQETRRYPVMLDWTGKVCAQLGYEPGLANILIIGRDGRVLGRFAGAAAESKLGDVLAALDKAHSKNDSLPGNEATKTNNISTR